MGVQTRCETDAIGRRHTSVQHALLQEDSMLQAANGQCGKETAQKHTRAHAHTHTSRHVTRWLHEDSLLQVACEVKRHRFASLAAVNVLSTCNMARGKPGSVSAHACGGGGRRGTWGRAPSSRRLETPLPRLRHLLTRLRRARRTAIDQP